MAQSLVCNDCGLQLKSVKEATDHNEATGHANFAESEEKVLACDMTLFKPCKIPILGSFVRICAHLCCTAIHFASCYLDFSTQIDVFVAWPSMLMPMSGMHAYGCVHLGTICTIE